MRYFVMILFNYSEVRDFTVQHHCGRILGGRSTDEEVAVKELVGRRHRDVLKKMQRPCLCATLNIARTFKVATH